MDILDRIKKDRLNARKDKKVVTTALLTTLLGEAEGINKSKQKLDIVALIKKFIKGCDEIIATGGYATDLALSIANKEKAILVDLLPIQLTEIQLKSIIDELVEKDMKSVQQHFKKYYGGQYNGGQVSQIVRSF